MRFAFMLSIALALAGCFSPDEPVESGTLEDPAPVETAAASGASSTAASEAAGSAEPSPQVAKEFPISFAGKTSTRLCAPAGPNTCAGPGLGSPENTFVELEYDGVASTVEATLTWSATTPLNNEMYIVVFALRSCGDNCHEMTDESYRQFATGPSPLALMASNVKLAEGEMLGMHVGVVDPTPRPPAPIYADYGIEQAFSVEGTLTAMVNATA